MPTWQAVGTAQNSLSALSVPWPAHAANDIGVLVVESNPAGAISTPSGWAHITGSPLAVSAGEDDHTLTVFWKRAASDAEADAAVNDVGHQGALIFTIRGCITTGDPWDVVSSDTDTDPTADEAIDIPGATTTVADCLVALIASSGVDTGTQAASGWANADLANVTERTEHHFTTGDGGGFSIATGEKAAIGAYGTTTATFVDGTDQCRMSIAFKPPLASTGVPAVSYWTMN